MGLSHRQMLLFFNARDILAGFKQPDLVQSGRDERSSSDDLSSLIGLSPAFTRRPAPEQDGTCLEPTGA